jgi:outer membrane protein assembly factor BamB
MRQAVPALLLVMALPSTAVTLSDWPQWLGPDRTNRSVDRGLLREWPASGPPRLWSLSGLGAGYGSVAVRADRVFVQGSDGKDSKVISVSRHTGQRIWSRTIGPSIGNTGPVADPWAFPGARGTPTIDGNRLYVLTESGDLACLRRDDGRVIWQRNILKDFGGTNIPWMISESPLIEGAHVVVTPGGPGATIVALDKMTGRTAWKSAELSDAAGHGSLIAIDVQGVRVLTTVTASAAVGVRASDGRLMWRYPRVANSTANVTTPVASGHKVFYTSYYDTGSALLSLTAQGGDVFAREVYFVREMQNYYGGVVVVGGYVYGFSGSVLTCLDFESGVVKWRARSVGTGSLTYADGHLYILGQDNVVALVEASPDGYRERGRFQIADTGSLTLAYPVVARGALFIRNQDTLTAYDVTAASFADWTTNSAEYSGILLYGFTSVALTMFTRRKHFCDG